MFLTRSDLDDSRSLEFNRGLGGQERAGKPGESQGVSSIFSPAHNFQELASEMTKDSYGFMGQSNYESFLEEKVALQEYKDVQNSYLKP